jgi:PPK2 family polyphosphate:nucleotide phosphotransferase
MTPSPHLATPGKKIRLSKIDPDDTGDYKDKDHAQPDIDDNLQKLDKLQELLYADARRAVLVVIQAMDAGGKDGAIEHVFSGVNPQGCNVTSFKVPSHVELAHDFLWRYHLAVPPKGMIGIFNRSHYESVLVERVKDIVPKKVWSKRYAHLRAFEEMLYDENVTVVKFYLHISRDEQKDRLRARLEDPKKNWKFNPGDLAERKRWDDYMEAFEDAINETSTKYAPWYVIPANKKWYRNYAIGDILVRTLKELPLQYPEPAEGLDKIKIE